MFEKIGQKVSVNKRFPIFLGVSVLLCAAGLIGLILLPFGTVLFNLDIDFVGGTTMTFETHTEMTPDKQNEIRKIVVDITGDNGTMLQKQGAEGTQIVIKTQKIDTDKRDAIFDKVKELYKLNDKDRLNVDDVSPSVGQDLQRAAVTSALLASALILIYIAIRFQFQSGCAAIIALIHDLLVMLSVYVIFQIPMNMNFIAAALTILGYSVNSTVILFDRVRENLKIANKGTFGEIVDRSIWQTMTRNINTTLTVIFVLVMLIIFGVPSIQNFTIPLLVGIVSGAYSSIFLSGPIWTRFRGKRNLKKA